MLYKLIVLNKKFYFFYAKHSFLKSHLYFLQDNQVYSRAKTFIHTLDYYLNICGHVDLIKS